MQQMATQEVMTKEVKKKATRKSVTTVADYVAAQLVHLPKNVTQRDVAAAIGYDKPNILVMIKRGDTKLPVNKVPALAKAIGVDPLHLMRLTLNEYMPEVHDAILSVAGPIVSENEMKLIKMWRLATLETDPEISITEDIRDFEALAARVSKIERHALEHAHDDLRRKDGAPVVTRLDS